MALLSPSFRWMAPNSSADFFAAPNDPTILDRPPVMAMTTPPMPKPVSTLRRAPNAPETLPTPARICSRPPPDAAAASLTALPTRPMARSVFSAPLVSASIRILVVSSPSSAMGQPSIV